jgi:2-dehydropantoate 2-reductase
MLDYAILGAGAVGCIVGGRLALAGQRVGLINRSPQTRDAVAAHGLLLTLDGQRHTARVEAYTVDEVPPARVVVVLTKTHQLEEAVLGVRAAVGDAVWVSLQNGLGNGARLAALVGPERTVHGVTMLPAVLSAPGEASTMGASTTWLGAFAPAAQAACEAIAADWVAAGIDAHVEAQVENNIWQKACFNTAMNALCALSQGGPGLMAYVPDGLVLAHELVDEISAVALADGAQVDVGKVHALVEMGCAQHRFHKPSMLQDILAQRLTEVEALNGFVDARAQALGVAAPMNRMLLRLLRLRERAPEFWALQEAAHG